LKPGIGGGGGHVIPGIGGGGGPPPPGRGGGGGDRGGGRRERRRGGGGGGGGEHSRKSVPLCLNRDKFQENLKGHTRIRVGRIHSLQREKGRREARRGNGGMIAGTPGKGGEEKGPRGGGAKSKPT